MKLPEDKKERTQILALVGIGVIAVGYGIVQFGVKPFKAKKAERLTRIEELNGLIEKAELKIKTLELNEKNSIKLISM